MKLERSSKYWLVIKDDGYIALKTHNKNIALRYMESMEKDDRTGQSQK